VATKRAATKPAATKRATTTAKTTGRKAPASRRKAANNTYARWNRDEIKKLRQLAKENVPTGKIGAALGRTAIAIQGKAQREGISLRSAEAAAPARAKPGAKRTAKRC
jgi:hypothetical protein